MAKYKVIRTCHHTEYACVEANSEEEAKDKAIENPNEVLLGYEYIAIKDE